MNLLSTDTLENYPSAPGRMNELGAFVFYRTYSRWLEDQKRRETWKEAVARAVDYNVSLELRHMAKHKFPVDRTKTEKEANDLFAGIFRLEQFLSGRTHWVGGAEGGVADKYPLSNFNCSFTNITTWKDLCEMFYLLLVGTGVGFKCTKDMAANLPPVRQDVAVIHSPYQPVAKHQRLENSKLEVLENGYAKLFIGDSKEGWVEGLRYFLQVLSDTAYIKVHTLKISYNSVRPKGERLKTFGGTASGHEPLQEMFEGFIRVINNQIDPSLEPLNIAYTYKDVSYFRVRPIHVLDMGNLIGNNVVVGGVRRTAEIFLFDADDLESMFAKYSMNGFWEEKHFQQHEVIGKILDTYGAKPEWWEQVGQRNFDVSWEEPLYDGTLGVKHHQLTFHTQEEAQAYGEGLKVDLPEEFRDRIFIGQFPYNYGRPLHHRRMSNNSVAFTSKPDAKWFELIVAMMKLEGEPGFINLEEAARRRLLGMGITSYSRETLEWVMAQIGLNPCAEILMQSKGVCNLTTVNVKAFVYYDGEKHVLDVNRLLRAQRLSARAGIRMTLVDLELPEWNRVQHADGLIGTSLTGWYDAMGMIGASDSYERYLLGQLRETTRKSAEEYCKYLRIPTPLLDTTVKPEGTLSQVAGGVSSGLHRSHAPYFIRRIRINSADPLAQVAKVLNWTINPEVGTPGADYMERMQNARTLVIDFPVESGASVTKFDVDVHDQFKTYFMFQKEYTAHNSSNTITLRDHEWGTMRDIVWDNWDNFVGVSFLALDGGTYELAPYEAITKEQYEDMKTKMKPFSPDVLEIFESHGESDLEGADACEGGACPIR